MCACCVLVVYASFIAVATWLAVELDESDALDMEFAAASIPLTCTVLTPERDAALLSARSAASQYLGDGVRISNIDPQTCHVLCSDREWSSRLPYYCYHSSVELDGENRAFLSDLAVNCTRDCVRTGSIDHRILTRVPNFAESWFQRQATTLAKVNSDRRAKSLSEYDPENIEKLAAFTPSTAPDLKQQELDKLAASLDMSVYGDPLKSPGFASTCYILPEPKMHPACDRASDNNNTTNASIAVATPSDSGARGSSRSLRPRRLSVSSSIAHNNENAIEINAALEEKELELEARAFSKAMFSYCPKGEDPCLWPAVSLSVPVQPRPLTSLIIGICTFQWIVYAALIWLWVPRIVRAIRRSLVNFTQRMRERSEHFKTDESLQTGRWAKWQQLWFVRLAEFGERVVSGCFNLQVLVVKLGVYLRCIDELVLINLLRGLDSFEEEEEGMDDEEEQAAKLEAELRQQRWDNLVAAILRAKDVGKDSLNLSRLRIDVLPKCIGSAPYVVKTLNLCENEIVDLAESPLLDLACLENLFLMDNRLLALPDMSRLIVLDILDVENNGIGRTPDLFALTKLPHSLRKLYLQKCQLTTIPDFVLELPNLQWLNLSQNRLADLGNLEGFDRLASLERIVLSHNRLKCLPERIGDLPVLQEFYATDNQLSRLPDSFCSLQSLRVVACNSNRIVMLPDELGRLTNLETIEASHNRLRFLPDSIAEITGLKRLVVSDNDIQDLPGWVGNMKEVVLLDFTANSIPKATSLECSMRIKKSNPYVVDAKFF